MAEFGGHAEHVEHAEECSPESSAGHFTCEGAGRCLYPEHAELVSSA